MVRCRLKRRARPGAKRRGTPVIRCQRFRNQVYRNQALDEQNKKLKGPHRFQRKGPKF
ncbi:hypothetical protein LEP1GSC108_2147 [Leptospira weilii str. UI 13098]|uniref:Uncharacterized protein n=1 Tax=Leptospira weilii str. UI 13098 TaxID=1088542 RepID=M6PZF7_9LEPT|nr:hypothetical protein LEP1GSC108_2147 [Leptospira weilii str. UI 13098]